MEPASAIPLVIIGSARKDGNTREITDAVLQGIPAKKIDLANHTILPYSYDGQYADDDFLYVVDEMLRYQTIIFATPVYWYAMSGAMKIFLDRFTDLVTIQKEKGRKLKGRNFLLLVVGSD